MSILEECLGLGTQRSLMDISRSKDGMSPEQQIPSPMHEHYTHALYQSAQVTLFRHMNNIINMLPVPHQVIEYSDHLTPREERYIEKMEEFFTDAAWLEMVVQLSNALLQYLVSLEMLPWHPGIPEDAVKDICRFTVLLLEVSIN